MESMLARHGHAPYLGRPQILCQGNLLPGCDRTRKDVAANLPVRLMGRMLQHLTAEVLLKLCEARKQHGWEGGAEAHSGNGQRWGSRRKSSRPTLGARTEEDKPVVPPLVLSQ